MKTFPDLSMIKKIIAAALIKGIPSQVLKMLQCVQNYAARIIPAPNPGNTSLNLIQLDQVPFRSQNNYKIFLLIYKSLHSYAP